MEFNFGLVNSLTQLLNTQMLILTLQNLHLILYFDPMLLLFLKIYENEFLGS